MSKRDAEQLARAHQLFGQHDRAVAEAKTVIRGWQTREDLGDQEPASRRAGIWSPAFATRAHSDHL